MTRIMPTSTASGSTSQMWNLETTSSRSVWTPTTTSQSLTTATTWCAVMFATRAATPICQDVTCHHIRWRNSFSKAPRINSMNDTKDDQCHRGPTSCNVLDKAQINTMNEFNHSLELTQHYVLQHYSFSYWQHVINFNYKYQCLEMENCNRQSGDQNVMHHKMCIFWYHVFLIISCLTCHYNHLVTPFCITIHIHVIHTIL